MHWKQAPSPPFFPFSFFLFMSYHIVPSKAKVFYWGRRIKNKYSKDRELWGESSINHSRASSIQKQKKKATIGCLKLLLPVKKRKKTNPAEKPKVETQSPGLLFQPMLLVIAHPAVALGILTSSKGSELSSPFFALSLCFSFFLSFFSGSFFAASATNCSNTPSANSSSGSRSA